MLTWHVSITLIVCNVLRISAKIFQLLLHRNLVILATNVRTTSLVIENHHPRRTKRRRNLLKWMSTALFMH